MANRRAKQYKRRHSVIDVGQTESSTSSTSCICFSPKLRRLISRKSFNDLVLITSEVSGRVLNLESDEIRALANSWNSMPGRSERIALFFYNFLSKVSLRFL